VKHTTINGLRFHITPYGLLPGVTTVLQATDPPEKAKWLSAWREKVGEEEADRIATEASERGTRIHSYVESLALGLEPKIETRDKHSWSLIEPEVKACERFLYIEKQMYHSIGFAGSPDAIAIHRGKLKVIDWKTSRKVKYRSGIESYLMQVSAYVNMANHMFDLGIKDASIIMACDTAKKVKIFDVEYDEIMVLYRDFCVRLESFQESNPIF